ncbi:hypothetical protein P7H17_27070 [Paenibacillus larvae]|nr:hypothetical protein [Paenibacillus larvae]MDT2288995.1 hypothetical protein [Paenibacillus larvae]
MNTDPEKIKHYTDRMEDLEEERTREELEKVQIQRRFNQLLSNAEGSDYQARRCDARVEQVGQKICRKKNWTGSGPELSPRNNQGGHEL